MEEWHYKNKNELHHVLRPSNSLILSRELEDTIRPSNWSDHQIIVTYKSIVWRV